MNLLARLLFVWIAICSINLAHGGPSDGTGPVGYVEQLAGNLDSFSIERAGRTLSPALLLPVQTGDRLSVRGRGNILSLQCGNRRIRVTELESPFVVPPNATPPGFLSRLGVLLLDVGGRLTTQQAKSVTKVATSSRGHDEPLAIPLLQGRTSHLALPDKTLYVAWAGGSPPYEVRVTSVKSESRQIAALGGIEDQRAIVALSHSLPIGFAQVEIIDHDGSTARGLFEVIPAKRLPTAEAALNDTDVPASLKQILWMDALLKDSPAEWSFQAYQVISPLVPESQPAQALRDCLERTVSCYDR
ncbi:hypothetical protein W02_17390 [Nitrospira sp. KM1]|uniref:hypothetical protein n=1 Tax=Nitrospira sp. KM1 TaxID=1936990 RepID=UPI0013A7135C|nr:hypothetical protein [Nitrospira sp. KM1]BCA54599.1 hypothetical protein W02_17390 [Nitrospira sp. KM1]